MPADSAAASSPFEQALNAHWRRVFNFAFRMTMSRDDASDITRETFLRAYVGRDKMPADSDLEPWLLRIANHIIEKRVDTTPEVSFDMLDDTLRSEATRTDVVQSLTNPQKEFLLWELKQGCMTSVINCLSTGERVAFVLSGILGMDDDTAARSLGIKTSAYKVRLSRARKKIGDYLAPRCEHIDPRNPCHCPSRIGVALRKGFIAPPLNAAVTLRKNLRPFADEIKSHDAVNIFRTLPEPEMPAGLVERLNQAVATGVWDSKSATPPLRK